MTNQSVLSDPSLQALVDRLHAQSVAQEPVIFAKRAQQGNLSWDGLDADADRYTRRATRGCI